jgi:polar amino acid transport system substrate-binding protein
VRGDSIDHSEQRFLEEKLDVLAGLRPRLLQDLEKLPGARILEGRFTAVQQAIGTPKGRPAGAEYLRGFAEDVKASGLVAELIARHKIQGLSVAAAA